MNHRYGLRIVSCIVCASLITIGIARYAHSFPSAPKPYKSQTTLTNIVSQPQSARPVSLTAKLLFMGDTMLARSIGEGIVSGRNPYQYVQPELNKYDVRIANLETTIADPSVSYRVFGKPYTFNAPLAALDTLSQAGITVTGLANNHTGDFGHLATANMIDNLQAKGIVVAGAGKNIDQAFQPALVQVGVSSTDPYTVSAQTIRVAIIAVNSIENNYTDATTSSAGSAYFDKTRIAASLKRAREDIKADVIIVIPHWGVEYQAEPTTDEINWGHFFIDNGADLVIGSHPHVTQRMDTYNNKYIIYSMGNFIFDGMSGDALNGQMIGLELQLHGYQNTAGILTDGTKSLLINTPVSIPTAIDEQGYPHLK